MDLIWKVAKQFAHRGDVIDVHEHGNGNINDTFLVTVNGDENDKFVMQRINTHVFTRPKLIIENMRTFTEHVDNRIASEASSDFRRWDVPHIRTTRTGQDYHIDSQGSFWRSISFVNHSKSYDTVQHENHAREVGYAIGRFQNLLSDLSTDQMFDTLEGFHITPHYLQKYDDVMRRGPQGLNNAEVRYCHQMIADRRDWLSILEDAKGRGELQMRTIHGDPKINNIMICDDTGRAVSVIDLDTVKPGLVHYDIGDCLRSSCNPLGEETTKFNQIHFEVDLARSILEGYSSVASEFLTERDYAYIYDSIRLLTFELGLRFFAEYIAGNVYFKVKHPEHNLERALVQFKLTESIEAQESDLRKIIKSL